MSNVERAPNAPSAAVETLDTEQLMRVIPHRYPFLLVDRIAQIRSDEFCIGYKAVSANEPYFQGHFPGRPVMPGVLLLEGMAQTAGAICSLSVISGRPPGMVYFLTVDKAKFRRPVVPGDLVEYRMTRLKKRKTMWWFRGEAWVGQDLACEAELGAMISEV